LHGNEIGSGAEALTHEWGLGGVGDWSRRQEEAGDGAAWDLDQSRTHNAASEVAAVSDADGDAPDNVSTT